MRDHRRPHRLRTFLALALLPTFFLADQAHGATASLTPTATAAPKVVAVPTTIDRTGGTDVTAKLTSFVNTVPDGSTISFPRDAVYRIDGSLRFAKRNNLVFEGNGASFKAGTRGDRDRRHWWFLGGTNITVRNMKVKGSNPHAGMGDDAWDVSLEAQHGFDFEGVDGVLVDNVTVNDVWGDFIYLGQAFDKWSRRVWIVNSRFERNGRQGISITAADGVVIAKNYMGQVRRTMIDIEPNGASWGAKNIAVVQNTFGPGRLLFFAAGGKGPVSTINLSDNVFVSRPMTLMVESFGWPRSNFTVNGNRSDTIWGNAGGSMMYFNGVDGINVKGNVQPMQPGRGNAGVGAVNSCRVAVSGNIFPSALQEVRVSTPSC